MSSIGLGGRAGNASLEQVAALFEKKRIPTGVRLGEATSLARLVARHSGFALPRLAPIVGEHVLEQ